MRLAIISSPRSGNTWLRCLLSRLNGLHQFAVHSPDSIDWTTLPRDCSIQIHWHAEPDFVALLKRHGFSVVTISRHPLDLLLSILHFSPREPQTRFWLMGEGGDETSIHNCLPVSPEFLSYGTGPRARALLSVTPEWWAFDNVVKVRYEDLVASPRATLETAQVRLTGSSRECSEVIEEMAIDNLRQTSSNQHFWKGCPGLWTSLLPAGIAEEIYRAQRNIFVELGYTCIPLQTLTREAATEHWSRIA